MFNKKGPTSKSFNTPKTKGKGFKKDTAPLTKNDKMDKLKGKKK